MNSICNHLKIWLKSVKNYNIEFFTIFCPFGHIGKKRIVEGGAANKSNGENGYDLHTLGVDKMVSTE